MNKQILNIINFQILYEILDEIKENLFFDVVNYKDKSDFLKNNKKASQKELIITKDKTLSEHNILFIDNFPISLNKLIELINIQLLRIKFNSQSKIKINDYDLDLNSKFFSKNGVSIKLTEKEIEIILYLNSNKIKHNVLDLQKNIWKYSSDLETHTVETHIYRLRKKIDDNFSDKNFILSHSEGYFIK
jgi:DNA-binding response OmpR family regulator